MIRPNDLVGVKGAVESMGFELPEADIEGAESFDSLRNLKRVSISVEAHKELRRGLTAGRFPPGTRLNIRNLAEAMNISPTPVREALLQLAAEGALTQIAGRSFMVPRFSAEDYLELRDLRLSLEGEGAARAALRIGSDAIEALLHAHERLVERKAARDFREALEWNREFHLRVCAEADMPRLQRIVEGLWLQMGPLLNMLYARREMPRAPGPDDQHGHILMIEAFRARDPEAARAAMQADILGSSAEILANLRQRMK